MNVGALRHYVTLDDPVEDRTPVVFDPNHWWLSIEPAAPGEFDEQRVTHICRGRYHPQVTFNTRITHRGRQLFVRGIQNVEERNVEMVLLCQEVKTP